MQQRTLGTQGLRVSAIGLGTMGMASVPGFADMYGRADDAESIATLHRALDLGVTLLDTAEMYGPFKAESLLGRALRGRRDQAVIATKFGFAFDAQGKPLGLDSRPENLRRALEGSLQRLGVDHIDLWYQHRVDPKVPIEETVGAMAELVKAGKVRFIGLCEASPATIRRAHAVHPISAVQSEYSLWERGVEEDVLPALDALGIGFVPYSPLGRGFLTGQARRAEDYPEGDYRRVDPRYQGENFARNLHVVDAVRAVAGELRAAPAQVALAWLLHQRPSIVPIPGTKRVATLEQNAAAAELALTPAQLARLDRDAPRGATAGPRYANERMAAIDKS